MATGEERFIVRLVPRGGRDAIEGVTDAGELRCRVSAPPAGGAANRALLRLVADALDVPPSAVSIESGVASRTKRLRVEGAGPAIIRTRWPGIVVS